MCDCFELYHGKYGFGFYTVKMTIVIVKGLTTFIPANQDVYDDNTSCTRLFNMSVVITLYVCVYLVSFDILLNLLLSLALISPCWSLGV